MGKQYLAAVTGTGAVPMSSITAINKPLGRWFLTRYGDKLCTLAIGKVAPFGIGAAIGAGGNRALGRTVVNTSRRVFGPHRQASRTATP